MSNESGAVRPSRNYGSSDVDSRFVSVPNVRTLDDVRFLIQGLKSLLLARRARCTTWVISLWGLRSVADGVAPMILEFADYVIERGALVRFEGTEWLPNRYRRAIQDLTEGPSPAARNE